jgi:hypothetical protein
VEAESLKATNDIAQRKAEEAGLALTEATQKRQQLQEDVEATRKKVGTEVQSSISKSMP